MNSFFDRLCGEDDTLEIELSVLPAVNFALVHSRIPILRRLHIRNKGESALRDVNLAIELHSHDGPLAEPWRRELPELKPEGKAAWADLGDFGISAPTLSRTQEAFNATLAITVSHPWGQPLRVAQPLRILAHNEWLGMPALFDTLAAFVQPNTRAVSEILREAAEILRSTSEDAAIVGYQRGPERAIETAGAIYEALRARELTYAPEPSSFEKTGQKIRTAESVLAARLGNCVDLSVAYAACLEQAGLHPLICVADGHAFAAVHRDDERLPESVLFDANSMINLVETGHVIPVEMTAISAGVDCQPFPGAVSLGRNHFRNASALRGLVDIRLAHRSGIDPLPPLDPGDPEPQPQEPANVPPNRTTTANVEPATPPSGQAEADAVRLPEELRSAVLGEAEEDARVYQVDDSAPKRVQKWRQSLLDLSLRNPLLNLPRNRTRGLDLHVPAGALAVLDDLVHAHKSLRIHSIDDLTSLRGLRDTTEVAPETLVEDLRNQRRVYGAVGADAYRNTMRALQRAARTMEQETGSNYLYLTLGALIHPRPNGGEARAPLFVVPVRIEGGAGKAPYRLLVDGQELAAPNYCLVEWLRVKHGADIPQLSEPILDDSGIDIGKTLGAIKQGLVDHQLPYRVEELASLRLLQFSTFQMWRDLTSHWEKFMANPVVAHLVEKSGQTFEDPAGDGTGVVVDESDLHLPIPADGSQMAAISMAEAGRSFVLEGPPGTGKSQTITNLITRLMAKGRTVLFVAEKQAALDVVKRRIEKLGLTPFVLDLHGRRQTMRSIREQLKRSLEAKPAGDEVGWQAASLDHAGRLETLRSYPNHLHATNAAELSAWNAYDTLLAYGDGQTLDVPRALMEQSPDVHKRIEEALETMPERIRAAEPRPQHPWTLAGANAADRLDVDATLKVANELEAARESLESMPKLQSLVATLDRPQELTVLADDLAEAASNPAIDPAAVELASANGWDNSCSDVIAGLQGLRDRHAATLSMFTATAFNDELIGPWAVEAAAASRGLFGKRRKQEALLAKMSPYVQPDHAVASDNLLATVEFLRAATTEAAALGTAARELPGIDLTTTWTPLADDAIDVLRASINSLISARQLSQRSPSRWREILHLSAEEPHGVEVARQLADTWTTWTSAIAVSNASWAAWTGDDHWLEAWLKDGPAWKRELETEGLRPLRAWAALQAEVDVLREHGMTESVEGILDGSQPGDELLAAFRRGRARTALGERLAERGLDLFDGQGRNEEIDRYLAVASALRDRVPAQIATEIVGRRKQAEAEREKRFAQLKKQLDRKRGGLSFRELFTEYGREILEITPCILMSPASVATFLSPDAIKFDLALFDEASQIRVPQAIGALGRAEAAVIVGDSRQMPPTSVMEVARNDEEEDASVPEDLESILSEAVESGLEQRWLSWHYRSRAESLIAFSNRHYYDNRLSTLPSPGALAGTGVAWRRVDGTYARGGARTNEVEADAIVEEIRVRLRSDTLRAESIGVVTFNVQQRDLILNKLEESEDELVQGALSRDDGEAIFVKNLENVQGDERDVILFSLAFSKDPDTGRLPLQFGPLINQGGERRLNVAVTRARSCVVLFSSFDPRDIDLSRTTSVGIAHLRAYMELAAEGVDQLGDLRETSDQHSERLYDELGAELEGRGLEVGRRIGLSDFRVDVAVRQPGSPRWQVAVLGDGPQWADRPTVTDRNGAPALLSEVMRWPAYTMLWLPEWVRDRETVLARITSLVEEASAAATEVGVAPSLASSTHDIATGPGKSTPSPSPMGSSQQSSTDEDDRDDPVVDALTPETVPRFQSNGGSRLSPQPAVPFQPFEPNDVGPRGDIDQLVHSERTQASVRKVMQTITEHEGPVQLDRLTRLTLKCFGFNRVASDRAEALAPFVPRERCVSTSMGTFVWPDGVDSSTWRGYRTTQQSTDRAFTDICPEEIGNAMLHVLSAAPTPVDSEDLNRRAMAALGYRRLTDGIRSRLSGSLIAAVQSGKVIAAPDDLYRPGA